MLKGKGSWILMMLAVLFLVAGANAALDPGVNLIPMGDMEDGGDAFTPPLYWSSVGTNPGEGTVGVSSDTPFGSPQSLHVTGYSDGGTLGTYSHGYSDQSGYAEGTVINISFDAKGDFYVIMACQNGVFASGSDYGHGEYEVGVTEWTHFEWTDTVGPGGVNGFSFYLYDNNQGVNGGWVDNLWMEIPPPALLMGDANRDSQVTAGDYASVQANFGDTGDTWDPLLFGDANMDGTVSAGDYASVQANFGNTLGASVPEPMTMSLLALGGLALIRRRK